MTFRFAGAIIRARFTEEKALALISDSGGSVFELSLKKTLGLRSYSSRCIFSGSRGEVCTFEPLNQGSIDSAPIHIEQILRPML